MANDISRFAIGDRDKLKYGADGSLELFIQVDNPGQEKQSNWLPLPANGVPSLTLRIYAPTLKALTAGWVPPVVRRVD